MFLKIQAFFWKDPDVLRYNKHKRGLTASQKEKRRIMTQFQKDVISFLKLQYGKALKDAVK